MAFGPDFIDKLKDRCTVYDIIAPYVALERRGRSYLGCCPFHNDSHPSFTVDPERGTYRCWSCNASGDIFTFLQEYKHMTFMEAVHFIADKVGIEVPQEQDTPEKRERKRKFDTGYAVLTEAAKFYRDCLVSGQFDAPIEYLKSRGIDSAIIKKFGFGYSPDYNSLVVRLKERGFSEESMLFAGVVRKGKTGVYDAEAKRLIVPLIDAKGRVVGFGGRRLEESMQGKYVNTQATPIFEKSHLLYNLNNFVKLRTNTAILVEGYFDVISLVQAGVDNVLAAMGTAFTDQHCDLFARYGVETIYVCFDGDSAGQAATLKSLDKLKDRGRVVKVVSLPDGMDPDDTIKKYGKDGFLKLVEDALPLIDYKLKLIETTYPPTTPDSKSKFAKAAMELLVALNDPVVAEVYVDGVAQLAGVKRDTILDAIYKQEKAKEVQPAKKSNNENTSPKAIDSAIKKAGRVILASILEAADYVDFNGEISPALFAEPAHKVVFDYILQCIKDRKQPQISSVYTLLENSEEAKAIDSALSDMTMIEKKELYLKSLRLISKEIKSQKIRELTTRFATAEGAEKEEIMRELAALTAKDKK